MRFLNIAFSITMLFAVTAQAQDLHYSQYYLSPLTNNPALTGHIEGLYRVAGLYRSQWSAISPNGVFTTPSISADANILDNKLRGSMGIGLQLINDRTSTINNTGAWASFAYHFAFEPTEKHHFLSLGVQGGFQNKQLNIDKVVFASQFDGDQFNANLSNGENIASNSVFLPDLNVGAVWTSYTNDGSNIELGYAYHHLLTTKETFYNNQNSLPARTNLHAAVNWYIHSKWSLHPYFLYSQQAKTTNMLLGANGAYHIDPQTQVYLGVGGRNADAFIMSAGLKWKNIGLHLAYDLNNSLLTETVRNNSAWELGVSYKGLRKTNQAIILPALRF